MPRKLLLLWVVCALGMPALPVQADTPDEQLAAASALYDAHKYADAAQKLDTFLAANPKHPKAGAAAFVLGRCRTELKQYPQAVSAFSRAVASKDMDIAALAQLGLGEAAIRAKQYDKALPALEAASKTALKLEQTAYVYYWIGEAEYHLNHFASAQEAYDRVTRDFRRSDIADSAAYGAGLAAWKQGHGDEAKQRFRMVVERYGKSENRANALLMIARMDLNAKRYGEARGEFEQTLREPGAQDTKSALHTDAEDGLIQCLLELKQYNEAAPRLESAINRLPAADPQRARALLQLGHCRYRQNQFQPALNAYQEAANAPESTVAVEAAYWAAKSLSGLNRPAEAAAAFARVAAKYPQSAYGAKAQLQAGDAYLDAKQNDNALAAYRMVVSKFAQSPEAGEARKMASQLTLAVSDPAKLEAALKTASPDERGKGLLRVARLYLDAGKPDKAAAALTDLLTAPPSAEIAGEAHYLLGVADEAQSKPEKAAQELTVALAKTPNAAWNGDAQTRLAWLYLDLKQPDKADSAAQKALAANLKPEAATQARLALAQAQLGLKQWDAAQETCKTLLANNPAPDTVAAVLFTQALLAEQRDKADDALPLWERLANEFPKSGYAPDALLHLGHARLKAEKYAEAKEHFAKLLADYPQSPLAPEARFQMGSALYGLNDFAGAASAFAAVADNKSAGEWRPEALYWTGVAEDKTGDKAEAIKRLTRLVTDYPTHKRAATAKIRLAALKAGS